MQCDVTSFVCISNRVEHLDKEYSQKILQKKSYREFKLSFRSNQENT